MELAEQTSKLCEKRAGNRVTVGHFGAQKSGTDTLFRQRVFFALLWKVRNRRLAAPVGTCSSLTPSLTHARAILHRKPGDHYRF
jgi:hypothetical protein